MISSKWQLLGENAMFRMARLVRADRKATVTQITIRYSRGLQKRISKLTNLEADGLRLQKTHWVPHLSVKGN